MSPNTTSANQRASLKSSIWKTFQRESSNNLHVKIIKCMVPIVQREFSIVNHLLVKCIACAAAVNVPILIKCLFAKMNDQSFAE